MALNANPINVIGYLRLSRNSSKRNPFIEFGHPRKNQPPTMRGLFLL